MLQNIMRTLEKVHLNNPCFNQSPYFLISIQNIPIIEHYTANAASMTKAYSFGADRDINGIKETLPTFTWSCDAKRYINHTKCSIFSP